MIRHRERGHRGGWMTGERTRGDTERARDNKGGDNGGKGGAGERGCVCKGGRRRWGKG